MYIFNHQLYSQCDIERQLRALSIKDIINCLPHCTNRIRRLATKELLVRTDREDTIYDMIVNDYYRRSIVRSTRQGSKSVV
jgi:hypothetical protein